MPNSKSPKKSHSTTSTTLKVSTPKTSSTQKVYTPSRSKTSSTQKNSTSSTLKHSSSRSSSKIVTSVSGSAPKSPISGAVSQTQLSSGANGVTFKITYPHKISVLKVIKRQDRDSLVYEYLVGKQINEWCALFPVFVKTRNVYYFKDDYTPVNLDSIDLSKLYTFRPSLTNACRTAGIQAVLTDYVKGRSLKSCMSYPEFNTTELAFILFHIYYALVNLRNKFTHYDLHSSNVLVFEPYPGKVVEYRYHMGDNVVSFRSRYAPKIIDYGRCFVENFDFSGLSKGACNTTRCGFQGHECGFLHYHLKYGSYRHANVSQDLRLLKKLPDPLKSIPNRMNFGATVPPARAKYTTEENAVMGFPEQINNIMDALRAIQVLLPRNDLVADHVVEVYGDKPLSRS